MALNAFNNSNVNVLVHHLLLPFTVSVTPWQRAEYTCSCVCNSFNLPGSRFDPEILYTQSRKVEDREGFRLLVFLSMKNRAMEMATEKRHWQKPHLHLCAPFSIHIPVTFYAQSLLFFSFGIQSTKCI